MTPEHHPVESGLGFSIAKDKTGFVGAGGVAALRGQPGGRALLCLVVDEGTSMVLGKVPVFIDGVPSGYVTSAADGHTVRTPLAYAWLPAETVE